MSYLLYLHQLLVKVKLFFYLSGGKSMLHTEEIEYQLGNTTYRAFVAHDKTNLIPKPCIMIAPDWSGRRDTFCKKAEQLAAKGYVGFTVDMYGNAKIGHTNEEKMALLHPIMATREQVAARMLAAYDAAITLPYVDNARIAAMGYCFGGLCVLDLARAGADVKGVISFHGILSAPEPNLCQKIRAKILVLHGYDDPMVPPTQVNQFANEMTEKKADWQIHMYGHTQHAFTNPEANDNQLGLHYDKKADKRSWMSAKLFLNEILKINAC